MKKGKTLIAALAIAIFTTGCGGGHGDVHVDSGHSGPHHGHEADYWPYLLDFHIIDSFGISTEDDPTSASELDPYEDEGLFDIYWDVDAVNDYIVEYRINDAPVIEGSRLIDAELCGIDLPCDEQGWQLCQYKPEFSMSCDVATQAYVDVNSTYNPLQFADMVGPLPQLLYFVVQICDTQSLYCEYGTKPILLF